MRPKAHFATQTVVAVAVLTEKQLVVFVASLIQDY